MQEREITGMGLLRRTSQVPSFSRKAMGFALSAASCAGLLSLPAFAQQRSRRPDQVASGKTQTTKPRAQAQSSQGFELVAAQAEQARTDGRLDEAIQSYRKAVSLRNSWAEGWWYLATLLYSQDKYAEAAPAFYKAATLQPKAGAPWAMLGLCEYQLGRYDDALNHIYQARQIGLLNNPELIRVMIYHEGLLLLLRGDFETAYQRFGTLAYEGMATEDLIIALGVSALRIPLPPSQITPTYRDRDLIRRVGFAELQSAQKNRTDAQQEYERILIDFPKTPNVEYAFGRFLLTSRRDDEGAMAAFKREIENAPDSAVARIQIAYLKLKNKETAEGIPFAEEALKFSPRNAIGHYILGRLLFDSGQIERSIKELETSERLAPNAPNIYFALARAYTRANRKADADRARETFTRLSKKAEEFDNKGFFIFGDDPGAK